MKLARFVCLLFCAYVPAFAQSGIPLLNQPLVPSAVTPGSAAFTLTVHGANFSTSSIVNWNGTPLPTTYVNQNQLTANVPAASVTKMSTSSVTVSTPGSGGGTSNVVPFTVTNPISSLNFQAAVPPVPNATSIAVGDFNGDGKQDLVVTVPFDGTGSCAEFNSGSVSAFLGKGDGTFTPAWTFDLGCLGPFSASGMAIRVGDFDNDGKLDFVVSYRARGGYYIAKFLGNGDGTFTGILVANQGFDFMGPITLGDFDRDGKLDMAFSLENLRLQSLFFILGNGSESGYTGGGLFAVSSQVTGDLNGDGILDFAAAPGTNPLDGSSAPILLGNGDGTFTPASSQPAGLTDASLIGDFNGDGILDLDGILLGNGDGTFRNAPAARAPSDPSQGPNEVVADVNADGRLDIVSGGISLGNGDGTFQPPFVLPLSGNPVSIAVADFDGDGLLDVISANDDGTLTVALNRSPRPAPLVILSALTLSFAAQTVSTSSPAKNLTVTNHGQGVLNVGSVSVTGINASDFTQTNTCNVPVAPSASCTISVIFSPTAVGSRSAAISLSDNGPKSPQTVSLHGTGVVPKVTLSPRTLTFPAQKVFTHSTPKSVTLTNSGAGVLTIGSIVAAGPFTQTNTCGTSVNPGATCTISITFNPKSKGALTGSITITDNAAPSPQTVALKGTGVAQP